MMKFIKQNPAAWPLVLKAPLLVAVMTFAVSAIITKQVLSRLEESQQRHLQQLTSAYLDGLSSAVTPAVVRNDVWEVFDNLDRSRTQYRSLNVNWTVVADTQGQVIASSDPSRFPTQSKAPDMMRDTAGSSELVIDKKMAVAHFSRKIEYQNLVLGTIQTEADIAPLLSERNDFFWTLIRTNLILTVVLAMIGFMLVRRMTRPVALLTQLFEFGSKGSLIAMEHSRQVSQSHEFKKLFKGYNALVHAQNDREMLASQLAEEEKIASLGHLASGMAHEINNPLGGMFNALDALKNHGTNLDVRSRSIRLIDNGLRGIRDLVRSTLTSYRADRSHRNLTPNDLDDLRLLIKPEARERGLDLNWNVSQFETTEIGAVPVRDAVLNLLINACRASERGGEVGFDARLEDQTFVADISDSGSGLPTNIREYIERKGAGSAPLDNRSGLGLWIVKRLCDEMNGTLSVVHTAETGTTIRLLVRPKVLETRDAA